MGGGDAGLDSPRGPFWRESYTAATTTNRKAISKEDEQTEKVELARAAAAKKRNRRKTSLRSWNLANNCDMLKLLSTQEEENKQEEKPELPVPWFDHACIVFCFVTKHF